VPSIVLANLILGENAIPERVQWDCTPEKMAEALVPLLSDTAERARQIQAFARLDAIMEIGRQTSPSERAAEVVAAVIAQAQTKTPG
jgi:lipid-A-disaccharide synthase